MPASRLSATTDILGDAKRPLNPISQRQIETVVSRSIGGIGLVFAAQTLPATLSQHAYLQPVLGTALAILMYGSVALVVLATTFKVGIRATTSFMALSYLVALLLWPLLVRDPAETLYGRPWLWFFCTVATSCAALAFPVVWAAIFTLIVPTIYGGIRMLPAGGGADAGLATLDVVYAVLLGQVIVIIIYMLRHSTAAVDTAQSTALDRYATAVRQHATEVERVQVDAIVHDSVLTTLLSAAAVSSPKEADLAASMAKQAIARLDEAGAAPQHDEASLPFSRLSTRIRQTTTTLALPFDVTVIDEYCLNIPVSTSEALFSATVQAMLNSMQHAGPPDAVLARTLTMSSRADGSCTIEIADAGVGFDPDVVPSGRLGLRISIVERVSSAGGVAHITTGVGHGTTITLEWPGPENKSEELNNEFTASLPVLGLDPYDDPAVKA